MSNDNEEDIPSSMRGWMEAPFKVYQKNGLVEKIETRADEPEFIVNMKKSLMSQLQLDISNTGRTLEQNQIQRGQPIDIPIFKSMESSILGECETIYSINKLPAYLVLEMEEKERNTSERRAEDSNEMRGESLCQGRDYYEIIKTKNLDNCKERPVFHNTFGLWSKSDGSMSSSVPSHSSVTRTIICGSTDSFVIRKSVTENEIQASALGHKESKAKLEIKSTSVLRLKSIGQVSEQISEPSSPKSYPSLVYEYGNGWMSPESLRRQVAQNERKEFAPMPEMSSSPVHALPRSLSKNEIKDEIVSAIEDLVKDTKRIKKNLDEDVAGVSTVITRGMVLLDYVQLKDIERSLESHQDSKLMKNAFIDLLAVTATNPCIKLLKEKVISGEISGETGSWVMAGALRAIRTPTGEVIKELTELLENHRVQESRGMESAIALSLSQLVHKACVNEETSKNEFPTKMYGKFCSEKSQEVEELTHVLIKNLKEAQRKDTNSLIIYVNALGNLGSEISEKELLKVIEGEITECPQIRSMAVYGLIKSSKRKPSLIRPILQTIIENVAENTQVRIAAITVLPFTNPSASDLHRLAIRTWFEPSKQVSAYIYSTIKSLKNRKSHPEGLSLGGLSGKATLALPLCKPTPFELQGSHNIHLSYFMDSLKTTVGSTLQVVSSEDSMFPRSIFTKSTIEGVDVAINTGEASLYLKGVESVLKQIYDMYSRTLEEKDEFQQKQEQQRNEREIRERSEKLNIVPRFSGEKPEAHLIMKMLDMQKVYSLDADTISKLRQEMETIWSSRDGLAKEISKKYIKVQDLAGLDMVMPTESGIPAYFTRRSPVVSYMSAELKPIIGRSSQKELAIEMKTIINYKREVQGGVITPLTNKAHGAGVDYSSFGALPLRGEVSYQHGQVSLTLKRMRDDDERPMVELTVRPYTTSCRVNRMKPAIKSDSSKDIRTGKANEKVIHLHN